MREIRQSGSEGGESSLRRLPYLNLVRTACRVVRGYVGPARKLLAIMATLTSDVSEVAVRTRTNAMENRSLTAEYAVAITRGYVALASNGGVTRQYLHGDIVELLHSRPSGRRSGSGTYRTYRLPGGSCSWWCHDGGAHANRYVF